MPRSGPRSREQDNLPGHGSDRPPVVTVAVDPSVGTLTPTVEVSPGTLAPAETVVPESEAPAVTSPVVPPEVVTPPEALTPEAPSLVETLADWESAVADPVPGRVGVVAVPDTEVPEVEPLTDASALAPVEPPSMARVAVAPLPPSDVPRETLGLEVSAVVGVPPTAPDPLPARDPAPALAHEEPPAGRVGLSGKGRGLGPTVSTRVMAGRAPLMLSLLVVVTVREA